MERPFDEDAVLKRVRRLSRRHRLAFLLSIAERLAPNYVAFHQRHAWGEPAVIQHALDLGWKSLAGEVVDRAEVKSSLARCEDATPDTEDFDSELVSAGLDAAVCAAYVLEMLLKDEPDKPADAASLARDTVDMYVQELESFDPQDPGLEQKILEHALMQRELRRQREDLDFLAATELTSSVMDDLARRWRGPSKSNIELPSP